MKISDFIRMKITPENRQFDMIKNIRFLDDKNIILAGRNTSTVGAFCEAFFDYVNRNYRSSRGAEKIIKSNRKKLNRMSGSESMIVVQRILAEISNDYAINHYHITCEMIAPAVKKAPEAAKPVTAAPAQVNTVAAAPVAAASAVVNTAQNVSTESNRIKALESELGRLQPEVKEPLKAFPNYAENNVAEQQPVVTQPAVEPVAEQIVQPVAEAVTEQVTEPVVETVADSVTEPVAETAAEVSNVPDGNLTADAVEAVENAAEMTAETVNEVAAEPAAEMVTEAVAEEIGRAHV